MSRQPIDPERLHDLLSERAALGLDERDAVELDAMVREAPGVDPESWERAAAALHLAFLPAIDALPGGLRERLLIDASRHFAPAPPLAVRPSGARPRRLPAVAWLGWVAAAAAVLALALLVPRGRDTRPSLAELQRRSAAGDVGDAGVVRAPWTATGDALAPVVTGEVIWSQADQSGYMLFEALAANDPAVRQYQLWIFDAERPAETPVDGGVFDVGPDGRAVVPITAKLAVARPTLFGVTIERPGGVVVSQREHLVATAAL